MTNQTEALAENLMDQARKVGGDPIELWVDRADLLLILAALSSQPPAPRAGALTDEEWQEIADEYDGIIWARLKRAIDAKLEARASLTGTAGSTDK